MRYRSLRPLVVLLGCVAVCGLAEIPPVPGGNAMPADYFEVETARLRDRCMAGINSLDDWKAKRDTYRAQLFEMLGLDPLPEKTDLSPVITGRIEHEQFIVENLHFQSRPHLYVTANLYIPRNLDKPAPTILYVCGHGAVKKDGVSYGNKAGYQHHGAWFARHGYVCLIIDSVQLGEIEGIHHGTYRYDMWWWNNRGYTPAGAEAWNCIRSLDYLETRPEADASRFGVTGRSGGGAYSWWIAALDERIKVAVPVAGITDLQNHVVDGTVEGHCDCMFFLNTHRWDYPLVAALVAPRPLLLSNSDKDNIFPLDGVYRTYRKVRDIYEFYGVPRSLGLNITEGPHKDTQELRIHAFVWFNRFLKDDESLIDPTAERCFEPEQLKVFKELPADQINAEVHETFVSAAPPFEPPTSDEQWEQLQDDSLEILRSKCFSGWPTEDDAGGLNIHRVFSGRNRGLQLEVYDFQSQPNVWLRMYVVKRTGLGGPRGLTLAVLDQDQWGHWASVLRAGWPAMAGDAGAVEPNEARFAELREMIRGGDREFAFVTPRGVGPTAWNVESKKLIQIRRRFMLLGQTLDGMRIWDIRRAIQTVRELGMADRLTIQARGVTAAMAVYAGLFEDGIEAMELHTLPESHRNGPIIFNVERYFSMDRATALAARRCRLTTD